MIDLHTPAYFSVDSNTPKKMIHKSVQISLTGIALSHHNTINGCFCLKKESPSTTLKITSSFIIQPLNERNFLN